ncbi:MAG: type VI secretion system contractile sheath large subunit [Candidatus Eisenbacteria bacterium]|nr:type VI secretion system contractile sheath large subunit [Candidatus Eisenbacteria bacterium]MCC7143856.1 type VI secretion system contractile sheath large subunit [Candidatus Eisenbacteria bacterium]
MADAEQEKQAQTGETVNADSLLDEIIAGTTKYKPQDESYAIAKRGLEAFMRELVRPGGAEQRVHQSVVNAIIGELDQKLSKQIDEILHHAEVQKLESAWRGLKLLVDRTDFRENIKIELLNVSKDDLLNDFEDSPEVAKSGLYKQVYTAEYGQFGGQPFGAMVANYEFSAHPQDIKLLQYSASVAAMAHAPFITAASPKFFGEESWQTLPGLKDLHSVFEAPQYAKWRSFRDSEDARYVGLTCPRFLLRLPYGAETVPVKEFDYNETVTDSHDKYLWGNTAFTFASRLTDSFAKYRWCPNITGPLGGGAVEDLPVHVFDSMGSKEQKIPTEILVSERREYELAEEGFMALTMRKGSDNACFFSASSAQKPKTFGGTKEGKEAETNYRLGTQLPYMFVVSRMAHYLKVIQRENIGSWKSKTDLNNELNKWISQYVSEMDDAAPAIKSRRPLREAKISVEDIEGEPGWYRVDMKIRPHFKYMGANFTLSLVGKLDKK